MALAWTAGCVDGLSYLRLGRVFTANMTGNTVLLGLAIAQGHGADAARSGAAFGGFAVGVVLAAALRHRPRGLAVEAVLLAAVPVVGIATGRMPLVALSAAAMGLQTGTMRPHTPAGVNVTYITGTTTSAVARWTHRTLGRGDGDPRLPTGIWVAYFAGGLCGGLLGVAWGLPAFGVPAGVTLAVALSSHADPHVAMRMRMIRLGRAEDHPDPRRR